MQSLYIGAMKAVAMKGAGDSAQALSGAPFGEPERAEARTNGDLK